MQRSSDSIASLAAALAKAQAELINPEKSQVATISGDNFGGPGRSFRYAPLSSGLDVVRKTLGRQGIATLQTTAVDQAAGIVNLTTLLAHSSGEWIASDWPVCAIGETATPHRMGAALTYARRYGLFTLVGIAGDDDLDAPDLGTPKGLGHGPQTSTPRRNDRPDGSDKSGRDSCQSPATRRTITKGARLAMLSPKASMELRDRLLAQMNEIASSDDAALWAYCNLRAKNCLTETDAEQVEQAFQARLNVVGRAGPDAPAAAKTGCHSPAPADRALIDPEHPHRSLRLDRRPVGKRKGSRSKLFVDKGVLAVPEPRRIRDRDHVRFVAQQPCLICGRTPSDAHHLRFAQSRALGRKVSDEFTVPLCRGHHRELHRIGDEAAWWRRQAIDAVKVARALWLESHPLPGASEIDAEAPHPLADEAAIVISPGEQAPGIPSERAV